MRKRILATLLAFVLLFSGGAVTAYAYNVAVSGGLKSTPYSLRWHSSMTTAKKNAISSACGAWTSAGYGKLAELSSYSHTNSYPTDNNYNEISFTDSLEDDVLAQCHRVFTSIFYIKITRTYNSCGAAPAASKARNPCPTRLFWFHLH